MFEISTENPVRVVTGVGYMVLVVDSETKNALASLLCDLELLFKEGPGIYVPAANYRKALLALRQEAFGY